MNRLVRLVRLGLMASILGLSACASTPVHYHTLLAPLARTAEPGQAAPFLIEVLPVGIPAQLDQPQLVVRQGDSGIAMLDGERWASPFNDEVHDALSAELTRRLNTQDIVGLPQHAGKTVLRVELQVRRFDAWPGQRVQLDADWSLGFAGESGNTRLSCGGRFDEPTSGGYPELVRTQQRVIAELAARIAEDARGLAKALAPGCS